jgi:hypothetical protein
VGRKRNCWGTPFMSRATQFLGRSHVSLTVVFNSGPFMYEPSALSRYWGKPPFGEAPHNVPTGNGEGHGVKPYRLTVTPGIAP